MKSIKLVLMLSAAVLSVACNDIIESTEEISIPERKIVLTATREGLESETRSYRLDDGSVWWGIKEEISVFYGSGSNGGSKFTSNNTSLSETAEFEGSISMSGNKEFWAVYPYSEDNSCDGSSIITVIPSRQSGSESNFADDAFPAVGKSNLLNMPFWNICGGIKFFVSRGDIKYVTFKGNNDEALAGKVKVALGSDGTPVVAEVVEPKTEVVLTAPEGGTFKVGKYYYITLLPTALQGGFTMSFRTEDERGTLVSTSTQNIKRSTFGVLKNIDSKVQEWNSALPEPDVVDLGLSVLWATFNVGASAPEEYGNYYAYGETEPKSEYTKENYVAPSFPYYMKNHVPARTVVYPLKDLPPEYDAASKALGGDWRMPTKDELEELVNDCDCSWASVNGVNGFKLTSIINGNCIFLPSAGYKVKTDYREEENVGYACFYWSSTTQYGPYWLCLNEEDENKVNYQGHWFSEGWNYYTFAFIGQPVRPVRPNPNPRRVEGVSLDQSEVTLYEGREVILRATVTPNTAANKKLEWASSNQNVLSDINSYIDYNFYPNEEVGRATALKDGATKITVSTLDGDFQASCDVTVMPKQEMEAVDLGLSVKWASQNLGSYGPEEYEDYYGWPGHKGSNFELNPEEDIVREILGDNWRMPTISEWEELIENCTWSWTTVHGVSGNTVTSNKNGKSIFLPAAGWRDRCQDLNLLTQCGWEGFYWSSTLFKDVPRNTGYGYYLQFGTNDEFYFDYRNSKEHRNSPAVPPIDAGSIIT